MKRIYEADFIRAVSTLGILCFHFWSKLRENHIQTQGPVIHIPNFTLGSLFVTVFFILSGAMLYYTAQKKPLPIKDFYKRRFLSIFPAFYLVFFPLHLKTALEQGCFFYQEGNPLVFLLSLVGMDGYFSYRMTTYYQIGEWFLGALILLYLLYPLLQNGIHCCPAAATGVIVALYLTAFSHSFFQIGSFQNLFSCLLSFWMGMLIMKHKERLLEQNMPTLISGIFFFLLFFVKLPGDSNVLSHLGGLFCFCFLYGVGSRLPRKGRVCQMITMLSLLSYPIYLVHHVIISVILNRISTGPADLHTIIFCFLLVLVLTILAGYLLHRILFYGKQLLGT